MSRLVLSWPLEDAPWGHVIACAAAEIRKERKRFADFNNETFVIEGGLLVYGCDVGMELAYDRESDDPPAWVRDGLIWRSTRAA